MRPTEFYALPTLRSEPWHGVYGSLVTLFDDESLENDLARAGAAKEAAGALAFDLKLFDSGDGERTISYEAAVFEGVPFAIVVRSGRGGEDRQDRYITDLDTFKAARSYIERWLVRADSTRRDVVPPDQDLDILQGTYGHLVMAHKGISRLVSLDHLDDEGRVLLFDERAFKAAFDRLVRPEFALKDRGEEFQQGIRGRRMRELTVPALLEAVPEGVRATDDFEAIPRVEGYTTINAWSPVLVASDDATYAIGVSSSGGHFTWCSDIRVERVGPAELYDQLARGAAPSP